MTELALDLLLVAVFFLLLGIGGVIVERVIPWWQDRQARKDNVVDLRDWVAESNQRPRARLW